jgi:superfamily I DNA and/or RNA helicase
VRVIQTLFDYRRYQPIVISEPVTFQDPGLNVEQQQAIMSSLASQSVHLIHGPPGTGKTKTVCELIVQAAKKGWKILACAGSNIAVDNIVERINISGGVRPCRIGHPSRMLQSVYDFCLDNLVLKTSSQKLMR